MLGLGKDATAGSMSARDWKTRLFVLRRDNTSQIASLSCYKDVKKRWQKQVKGEGGREGGVGGEGEREDVLKMWREG